MIVQQMPMPSQPDTAFGPELYERVRKTPGNQAEMLLTF